MHLPTAVAGTTAADIVAVAREAEDLGFDSVWMFDHLFTPTELSSAYPYSPDGSYPLSPSTPFFDPVGLLGALAGSTSRVKLGTNVLVGAYRHPIVLGKALATIENVAPGRVLCGLGVGWMREEFEAVGVPYERRGARLSEYAGALRAVWSRAPTRFDGEFYRWPEAGFLPAPTTSIPLLLGGHSDAALRRAARLGDGWAAVTGPGQGTGIDALERRLEVLRGFLADADPHPAGFHVVYQGYFRFSKHAASKLPLTGQPEDMAEAVRRLEGLGVTTLDLFHAGNADAIRQQAERFAAEVRPLVGA